MSTPTTPSRLVLPKSKKKQPYDYIEQHYRDPGDGADPIKRWLPHPDVARAICGVLAANGCAPQDLQDGLQDVYVKALRAFQRMKPPTDLAGMKALCRKMARDLAIDRLRKAAKRARDFVGNCENPDDFTPLEYGAPAQRDPVDAGRQLEVLADLFREGRMPEHGVDVLEGVASGCTHGEIAEGLRISVSLSKWRTSEMRRIFRTRMAKLGLLPDMLPLRVILSAPEAIATLRDAA